MKFSIEVLCERIRRTRDFINIFTLWLRPAAVFFCCWQNWISFAVGEILVLKKLSSSLSTRENYQRETHL
jgi:hypothetical protein